MVGIIYWVRSVVGYCNYTIFIVFLLVLGQGDG